MWAMLQQPEPDDYVVATGETHEVREFVQLAFAAAGIDDWERYVRQDARFYRPAEVDLLVGDASKATRVLDWKPEVDFQSRAAHGAARSEARDGESTLMAADAGPSNDVVRLRMDLWAVATPPSGRRRPPARCGRG